MKNVRNADKRTYNCGGYALGTFDWYRPYKSNGELMGKIGDLEKETTEQHVQFMLKQFKGRLRLINNEEEAKPNERVIFFREDREIWGSSDFHFIIKARNGRYYHKMGGSPYIGTASKEAVYNVKGWSTGWSNYNSKMYIMAFKEEEKYIYFDMDGTICDLYGVSNWLQQLQNHDTAPYALAKPLVDMRLFDKLCKQLQAQGYKIGLISWLAKNSTKEYDKQVRTVKKTWLKENSETKFDHIHIVKYGTNKAQIGLGGILFDDEEKNNILWEKRGRKAVNCLNNPSIIINSLKSLLNT